MDSQVKKTVLITPQHWGLGHITRSIPVIRYFINQQWHVLLASSGAGNDLLRKEFPELQVFELPDYGISYPSKNMYWNMLIQLWKMHRAIVLEHFKIRSIAKAHHVDLIVSDARLGAAQKGIYSIIISHHLHFPLGYRLFEWMSDTWMRLFYILYDQLWIPDYPGDINLSGDLAHKYRSKKHFFVGPLSRFKPLEVPAKYNIAFVLSGPEPQRSYLEQKILEQCHHLLHKKMILVRGTNQSIQGTIPAHLEIIDLAVSEPLNEIMCASDLIVCRSGYSTLLDLCVIKKPALLIPTPGQPEQIYLAEELKRKKLFYYVDQDALDLVKDLAYVAAYKAYVDFPNAKSLVEVLDERLKDIFVNKE